MNSAAKSSTFKYFAYGSNMLKERLCAAERCPSAVVIGTGYVEGRRLTFDKVSQDGSGKCDAEPTRRSSDRVYGVLFDVALAERDSLNKAEGLGKGYEEETVRVVTAQGSVDAVTFIATRKEPALRPYHWYKALTVAGAVEQQLPAGYVEWLRTADSVEDPDSERRARNEALLFAR